MPGKRYSAGAIFLQVVPVFANVQRAIEDEAKGWNKTLGDELEKGGDKAGERAGRAASKKIDEEISKGSKDARNSFEKEFAGAVDEINKHLNGIDMKRLPNEARKELAGLKREMRELKDTDLFDEKSLQKARGLLHGIEGDLNRFGDTWKRAFQNNISDSLRGIDKLHKSLSRFDRPIDIPVKMDGGERVLGAFERAVQKHAQRAGSALEGSMNKSLQRIKGNLDKYLNGEEQIGITVSAGRARAEIAALQGELKHLSMNSPEIDVKVSAAKAYAELAAFTAAVDHLDGRNINIDTKESEDGMRRLSRGGEDAANTFRSFNIIMLAVAGAGPALVPILAAIAGGLVALGPAAAVAGAGLASVLVGFSGIGGALQALQARQDGMEKSTQQYAKTEQAAAKTVADARRTAARAIASALEQQRQAQESYKQSVQDVKDAEQALADARAAHANDGKDLQNQIDQNKLDIRQGVLDAFDAKVALNATLSDGSATDAEKEQAKVNYQQANLRLKELRQEQAKLAKEKAKWDKEGVNGTDAVKSAQDQLNNAIQRQKDAYHQLQLAAQAADQARADGARNVKEALDAQAQSMDAVNAQQANVDAAFAKLGKSGQKFALFLFGLRKGFYQFRDDIQSVLLPSVQKAITGLLSSKSAKIMRGAMIGLADGFGKFVQALSVSFQGKVWQRFFQMLADLGPKIQAAYGRAFISFLEGIASLLTTAAPFALRFADGLAHMMRAFANWAKSKKATDGFQGFMGYVKKIGPEVLSFLGHFVVAVVDLAKALAPWGEIVLKVLDGFLKIIDSLNPSTLQAIVTGIFILITASQMAYAIGSLVISISVLLSGGVTTIVFAVVALAAAFAFLALKNKGIRDFMKKAWKEISATVSDAWNKYIKPAIADLMDALTQLWNEVLKPFFRWLAPILLWVALHVIPILFRWWGILIHGIAFYIRHILIPEIRAMAAIFRWLWKNVLKPTWDDISAKARWLWKKVLKPAFEGIAALWKANLTVMEWVWDHILKPVFDFIVDKALPKLKNGFQNAVDGIKTIWNGLKAVVGAPIKFVLDTVINKGLIAGFNKVAGWVGLKGKDGKGALDEIKIPAAIQQYASGGVMRGYTPGRDVHDFYSPTAGRLRLSGGEAVMRPEWTRAMGRGYVDQMNAIARSRGVEGVRAAMSGPTRAFAGGGVLDDAMDVGGGMKLSRIAVAQLALAKRYYNLAFNVMQGGFGGNHVAASGTSHNYPGVADLGPGSIPLETGLRKVGFAAWARNIPGRMQVGSGAHVHAVSLLDPGDRKSPQVTGSWPNHGNGLSGYNNDPAPHPALAPNLQKDLGKLMGSDVLNDIMKSGSLGGGLSVPGWIKDIIKGPIGAVKGWITGAWGKASNAVKESPAFDIAKRVPLLMAEKMATKVWDIIPGWAKNTVGVVGDVVNGVIHVGGDIVGGVKDGLGAVGHGLSSLGSHLGLKDGGILPYNGTMMYDNGGYLPPGLTSVMNLTGKPEPVFTNDQWSKMEGGAPGGGSIHYEPHFEGSDLTAEDVASDLNFQFRKMRRGGKYQGVGQ